MVTTLITEHNQILFPVIRLPLKRPDGASKGKQKKLYRGPHPTAPCVDPHGEASRASRDQQHWRDRRAIPPLLVEPSLGCKSGCPFSI